MSDEEAEIVEQEEEREAILEKAKEVPDPVTLALMQLSKSQEKINNDIARINEGLARIEARHNQALPEAKEEAAPELVEVEGADKTPDGDDPASITTPERKPGRKSKLRLGRNRTARTGK